MASSSPLSYRWQGSAMLRATTDPGGLDLPRSLDLSGGDAAEQGREWLARVWQRAEVRDALSAASPGLCRQVGEAAAGKLSDPRRVRRAVLSIASYLLRWQQRPTPFGLFAGIAPVRVGTAPQVSWGEKHRTAVRADAEWLADIAVRLERCPGLLERLPVVANSAGQVRGDRYVVPGLPADGRAHLLAPVEVSVRLTRPVAAALDAARAPIRYAELRAQLQTRFPDAGADRIDALLHGLVAQNVLVSSLWAPMTCLDALAHICAELEAAGALGVPDAADLVRRLNAVRNELTGQDPDAQWSTRAGLIGRMRALCGITAVPLAVDTSLDCGIQLPEEVVREAQEAVGALYRLTPHPFGYQQWREYHGRFRARYGVGAVVPVLELVADSGLGLPAEYLGSSRGRAARRLTERDEKLLALVQRAMLEGSGEIVLTRPVIEDLAVGDDEDVIPVPRAEVAVEIHAASLDALERGSFRLVVTGTPRPGSSMAGRFAHLLPAEEQARLAAGYEASDPEAIAAQLSFAPRRRRNENITRTRQLLPHVVPLGEHREPHGGVIPLADLAVTADARWFFLVQLSTGRRVEPRVLHALEAGAHTPPLARFLAEITTARCAVYKAFDFGAAARLPYLPRVRYRRTVLAPARWLLAAQDLPGRSAAAAEWEAGFEEWRTRLRVPERVTMVDGNQRLPLDLTHPLHRLLLRTRLDSARRLELREAPSPEDLAWLGRAHELLLPLVLRKPASPGPLPTAQPVHAAADGTSQLPGRSAVLHAQVHAHPARYDEILTSHLPDLISALGSPPQWWFRRHRLMARPDADQYLALYVRLPGPGAYGRAAEQVHDWADRLHRMRLVSHLALAAYEPQPGRYGCGPAMEAAQAAFTADSAAALAQIRSANLAGIHPQTLASASMVDLAICFSPSPEQGLHWLVRHLPQGRGPLDRALRDQAFDLTASSSARTALRSLPGGEDVANAWQARAAALAGYRECLAAQRDPLTVLRSLLHLHHVRAVGTDPEIEAVTNRLARACALRCTARHRKG